MSELLFKDESYALSGAIFEVSREMGIGFLEAVYQECLAKEFAHAQIPFIAQRELTLTYKGASLVQTYKPDFICYDQIIIELKVARELSSAHMAQMRNYLKATGLRLGLLVNFGAYPKAVIERVIN